MNMQIGITRRAMACMQPRTDWYDLRRRSWRLQCFRDKCKRFSRPEARQNGELRSLLNPNKSGPTLGLASGFRNGLAATVSRHLTSVAFLGGLLGGVPAMAQDGTRSVYTALDLKSCTVLKAASAEGSSWLCPGLPGYPIYLAEGDDRMFFSAGPDPQKRRAAEQTLKAFNSVFIAGSGRATVEWRIPRTSRKAQPFASILRFYTSSEAARGQVLVVSKITPSETCHAALIDAEANPDANERARLAADTTVRAFKCTAEPAVEGARGKNPF